MIKVEILLLGEANGEWRLLCSLTMIVLERLLEGLWAQLFDDVIEWRFLCPSTMIAIQSLLLTGGVASLSTMIVIQSLLLTGGLVGFLTLWWCYLLWTREGFCAPQQKKIGQRERVIDPKKSLYLGYQDSAVGTKKQTFHQNHSW